MNPEHKRHWHKIGVELEGGWDTEPTAIAKRCSGAQIRHDGSVGGTAALFHGEVITRPHETLNGLLGDIKKLYPEYMNDSCGFHIHTSFSPMDTSVLADKTFNDYYHARWETWGKANKAPDIFWRRLKGLPTGPRKQVFCNPAYMADQQLKRLDKGLRYTALNFISWHQYGTIESRLLPMFESKELMESSVLETLDIFESYLNEVGFKTIEMERKVVVDFDGVKESYDAELPVREMYVYERETSAYTAPARGKDISYTFEGAEEAIAFMRPFRTEIKDGGGY